VSSGVFSSTLGRGIGWIAASLQPNSLAPVAGTKGSILIMLGSFGSSSCDKFILLTSERSVKSTLFFESSRAVWIDSRDSCDFWRLTRMSCFIFRLFIVIRQQIAMLKSMMHKAIIMTIALFDSFGRISFSVSELSESEVGSGYGSGSGSCLLQIRSAGSQ